MTPAPEPALLVRWSGPTDEAELAAMSLWDQGATAVEQRDAAEADDRCVLIASYPTAKAARVVAERLGLDTESPPDGWADRWKAFAQPVSVTSSMTVVPGWKDLSAWRDVPAPGGLVLKVDPGQCFGSGSHPSTRLMLGLLAETPPVGLRVLDVGTGSGILAVAAARLGAASVVGIDVDPTSPAIAQQNAAANQAAEVCRFSTTPLDELSGSWDMALVNVTAGVQATLAPGVLARVHSGGTIVVAGLLPGQWQHVTDSWAPASVVDLPVLDGWCGAVLRR